MKEHAEKQKYYQKQQSKHTSNADKYHDNDNHQENGYVKKSRQNGEVNKHNSKQSSNNQAYDGYQGSYYGSRPMSQQSNMKSY